jgi:hypothetical protein
LPSHFEKRKQAAGATDSLQHNRHKLQELAGSAASTLDLRGSEGHAIHFDEHLFTGSRLAVHSNQVAIRFSLTHIPLEQILHRRTVGDFDVICEASSVVVDVQNSQWISPKVKD